MNGYGEGKLEDWDQMPAMSTRGESFGAAFDLAKEDTALSAISDINNIREMREDTSQTITPEEANLRYPNMPTPFREPVNPRVAQYIADGHEERTRLQKVLENGPQDTLQSMSTFGAGLAAHLTDPVEFGLGTVASWAAAPVLGTVGLVAGEGATTGARLAATAGEGLLGNAIQAGVTEGLVQTDKGAQGEQIAPGEVAQNLLTNILAGTLIHTGLAELKFQGTARGERILKEENFVGPRPEVVPQPSFLERKGIVAKMRSLVNMAERDLKPDQSLLMKAIATETDVNPGDFGGERYTYSPIEGQGKPRLFMASTEATNKFAKATPKPLGDFATMGPQLSDNPGVANAKAASSMADSVGAVHQVTATELRPLRLEGGVPEPLRETFSAVLDHIDEKMGPETNVKEVLHLVQSAIDNGDLSPGMMQLLKTEIQGAGYNSLVSDGTTVGGFQHSPHNLVTMLDESILKPVQAMEADPSMVRTLSPDEAQALRDQQSAWKNKSLVDEQAHDDFLRKLDENIKSGEYDPGKSTERTQKLLEDLKNLEAQDHFSPEERAEFKQVSELLAKAEVDEQVLNAATLCVGR